MKTNSRYLIGIDLGTTNSALAYVDTCNPVSQILNISQIDRPGRTIDSPILPSACYIPPSLESGAPLELEFQNSTNRLNVIVGRYAREQAEKLPGRVVQSAKSWLCHSGVQREEKFLPWGSFDISEAEKLSPVESSAAILKHFKDFWDFKFGREADSLFENQGICITVPASFDEAAQHLTLEAARMAGYPDDVCLLEEPQAAFYFWLQKNWPINEHNNVFSYNENRGAILVVDVGGGTTDLSLFSCRSKQDKGIPEFKRLDVSEHLLLGGDNIDLAIAHHVEPKLTPPKKSDRADWAHLIYQSRTLKERVLSGVIDQDQLYSIATLGSGGGLFGSSRTASISGKELVEIVLEGFFPLVSKDARADHSVTGLREWGLPYAQDSAVTAHIAEFLEGRKVGALLCNGGTLKPSFLQERIQNVIASFQDGDLPFLLSNQDMDLAVAHGAAWYLWVLRSQSGLIKANYPHSVYLGLGHDQDGKERLICILPRDTEPGKTLVLHDKRFKLLVNQTVSFQVYHSHHINHREADAVGSVVIKDERKFVHLPELRIRLESQKATQKEVNVELRTHLTETGLLKVYCDELKNESTERSWQLEFNLRSGESKPDNDEEVVFEPGVKATQIEEALRMISSYYGKAGSVDVKSTPKNLIKNLESLFKKQKEDWNTTLLRTLWVPLAGGITKRGRSLAHEITWLYLSGYVLRPGYGADMDKYRVAELWRAYELGMYFQKEKSVQVQWWIMWRRVAGGLEFEQQRILFDKCVTLIKSSSDLSPELVRLVGSLERVPKSLKEDIASHFIKRLAKDSAARPHILWSLGRLGSRYLMYAGIEQTLSPSIIESWFDQLSLHDWRDPTFGACHQMFSQCARLTNNPDLDVSENFRAMLLNKLHFSGADAKYTLPIGIHLVPDTSYQSSMFGESLPAGLRLVPGTK